MTPSPTGGEDEQNFVDAHFVDAPMKVVLNIDKKLGLHQQSLENKQTFQNFVREFFETCRLVIWNNLFSAQ